MNISQFHIAMKMNACQHKIVTFFLLCLLWWVVDFETQRKIRIARQSWFHFNIEFYVCNDNDNFWYLIKIVILVIWIVKHPSIVQCWNEYIDYWYTSFLMRICGDVIFSYTKIFIFFITVWIASNKSSGHTYTHIHMPHSNAM